MPLEFLKRHSDSSGPKWLQSVQDEPGPELVILLCTFPLPLSELDPLVCPLYLKLTLRSKERERERQK